MNLSPDKTVLFDQAIEILRQNMGSVNKKGNRPMSGRGKRPAPAELLDQIVGTTAQERLRRLAEKIRSAEAVPELVAWRRAVEQYPSLAVEYDLEQRRWHMLASKAVDQARGNGWATRYCG